MNAIAEYDVAHASELADLCSEVNYLIEDGWKPLGGICATKTVEMNDHKGYEESETVYYQAMVREAA